MSHRAQTAAPLGIYAAKAKKDPNLSSPPVKGPASNTTAPAPVPAAQNYKNYRQQQAQQQSEEGPKVVRWIHLRYYPPGLILDYVNTQTKRKQMKLIDLLDLTYKSDMRAVVDGLMTGDGAGAGLLNEGHREYLEKCVYKLKQRMKRSKKEFQLHKSYKCHCKPILCAGFSRQGNRFATGAFDKTCKIWDLDTETEITLTGHSDGVVCVMFDCTGEKVLTGSYDRTVRCWKLDTKSGKGECVHTLQGPVAEVETVQYNMDGHLCAVGSSDKMARVYDLITGLTMYSLRGHSKPVTHVQFDTSSNALLTGSLDNTLGLWDLRTGDEVLNFVGHDEDITACSFNYQSDKIVSSSWDCTVRVWDVRSARNAYAILTENLDRVNDVKWNSTGTRLVSGGIDGVATVWDAQTCEVLCSFGAHSEAINNVNFSSNSAFILTDGDDHAIGLWKAETGEKMQKLDGHQDRVLYSTFDYLSDTILSVSKDNVCNVWKSKF